MAGAVVALAPRVVLGLTVVVGVLACQTALSPSSEPATPTRIASASPNGTRTTIATETPSSMLIRRGDGTTVSVQIEVARTPQQQEIGFSGRAQLAPDAGMLFVFPADTRTAFWMRGTTIPLSIAFVGVDGVIVDLQDMQPLSDDRHAPPLPIRYALEVNQGFFESHEVRVGNALVLTPDLR